MQGVNMNTKKTELLLTEADQGKSIAVKPGAFITVTLPSDEEHADYRWVDDSPQLDSIKDSGLLISKFRMINQYLASGMSVLSYKQSSMGAGKIKINLVAPDGSVIDRVGFGFMATR